MSKERIIPIFVPHFGCPNMCVFCNQRRISGHSGLPDAEAEIEAALPYSGEKPQIAFYGGSFTAIEPEVQERLLATAFTYVRRGLASSVRVSTRPDCIDDETVERLKRFAVTTVELGVQSLDDRVLRLTKRGHSAGCVEDAVELLRRAGIKVILQMMTGLPGDTGNESIATAEKIINLRPDGVRIYPTAVLPDTELADMMAAGEYTPQSVEDAVELCAKLADMFEDAGIPVIRLGLNPSRELDESVIAGAYHPALGELVLSRRMLKRAAALIDGLDHIPEEIVIGVNRRRVSPMTGQKRENITALRERYDVKNVKVVPADVPENEIRIIE